MKCGIQLAFSCILLSLSNSLVTSLVAAGTVGAFAGYRLDKQLCFRVCYLWKKIRWYVLGLFLLMIAAVIAGVVANKYINQSTSSSSSPTPPAPSSP